MKFAGALFSLLHVVDEEMTMTLSADKMNKQIHPCICIRNSGKIKIKAGLIESINEHLCTVTKTNDIDSAYKQLKRESKTKIKTKNTSFPEVSSVPRGYVQQWIQSMNLKSVPGLNSKSDLIKGKYEGGFKVWESTLDLISFVTEDQSIISELLRQESLKILELGAGAALPSLALIGRLSKNASVNLDYRIHIQDYNWEVLTSVTLLNLIVNLPGDHLQALIDSKNLRLFHGDWKNFRLKSNPTYDLIIMSEVIYDSSNYESLHDLLSRVLQPKGYIVIATKDTYFGLSGGIYSWLDYLETKSVFSPTRIIKVTITNIPRSILILQRSME